MMRCKRGPRRRPLRLPVRHGNHRGTRALEFRFGELTVRMPENESSMAKCDEGYFCEVCQQEVANITESDLYLRFVTGLLDAEVLHTSPERHIRCNPPLAQYIEHEDFPPVVVEGPFDKRQLDSGFVDERQQLVTRGWLRLQELHQYRGQMSVLEYPLPEVLQRIESRSQASQD